MFKSLSLLVLSCAAAMAVSGQVVSLKWDELQDMDIDYINKQIHAMRHGNLVMLEIENINRFLYEIEIEGESFELQTPVPSELQAVFRLGNSNQLSSVADPDALNDEADAVDSGISDELADLSAAFTATATSVQISNRAQITTDVRAFTDAVRDFNAGINALDAAIAEMIVVAKSDIDAQTATNMLYGITDPVTIRPARLISAVESAYITAKSSIFSDTGYSKEEKESLEAKLKGLFDKIRLADINETYTDALTLFRGLQNPNNFRVASPPVQMKGDGVTFEITIRPTKTSDYAPYRNPIEWELEIPSYGGMKVDFSVGAAFSTGNSASNRSFFTVAADDQVLLQELDNQNALSPGIASFMHVQRRRGRNTNYGFCFGVGAGFQSVDDIDLSTYFGASAVMGTKQKVVLSAGASFLRLETLKSSYDVGRYYDAETFDMEEITQTSFRPSFFFAVSYAIANRVAN